MRPAAPLAALALLLTLTACGGSDTEPSSDTAAAPASPAASPAAGEGAPGTDNVTITACGDVPNRVAPGVRLTVANPGTIASDYEVTVAFTDADGVRIAEVTGQANGIEPGGKTRVDMGANEIEEPDVGAFTCKVTKVVPYPLAG